MLACEVLVVVNADSALKCGVQECSVRKQHQQNCYEVATFFGILIILC